MRRLPTLTVFTLMLLGNSSPALPEPLPSEEDRWWLDDAEERAAARSEGALKFLAQPPTERVHHHHNTVTLTADALVDGWAALDQCHTDLDPVPRAEVVYNEGRIRALRIVSAERIGRAWVEGPSVQLENVGQGARLCIEAETRALHPNPDGTYSLRNGPFMRKFLDAYYPMRVSMDVSFPQASLRFLTITPPTQPGFRVWREEGAIHFDTWFEGRLETELRFQALP